MLEEKMNLNNVKKYKNEFIEKVGTYEGWAVPHAWPIHESRPNGCYPSNSIFFSEALALYTLAKDKEIDIFIESGVYRGGSTSVWGRVFPDLKIYSIDYVQEGPNPRLKWEGVQSVIKPLYPQIEFIEGDGYEVIPELIEKHSDKKLGVFVDGPKYPGGLMLAESCFNDYENVLFSSLHDHIEPKYFTTHDLEFREIIGTMDSDMNHPQCEKYPKGAGLTIIC
tara:strand:+ start:846 stop:1514 length:669 start_codon:yes stop_codon:yes gene_type:complete